MQQEKTTDVCTGLELGTLLHVQFQGVGSAKTSIIGIDRDKCLIVKPPALVGIETKLFKKNQTIVHYFHDGMIFGFRCTLIGFVKTPFPLLILSYPEAVQQRNLRKYRRFSCLLNGQLLIDSLAVKIVILDISPTGCRLAVPDPAGSDMPQISLGGDITFTVDMNETIQETVTFTASVHNLQTDGNGLMIGAEFHKAAQQTDIHCMEKLKKYIAAVQESLNVERH
jgi:hypothetical protein